MYFSSTVNLALLNQWQAWQTCTDQEKNRRNYISFITTPGHFLLHLLASLAELSRIPITTSFFGFIHSSCVLIIPFFFFFWGGCSLCVHLFLLPFTLFVVSIQLHLHLSNNREEQLPFESKQQLFAKYSLLPKVFFFLKEIKRKILLHKNHLWVAWNP